MKVSLPFLLNVSELYQKIEPPREYTMERTEPLQFAKQKLQRTGLLIAQAKHALKRLLCSLNIRLQPPIDGTWTQSKVKGNHVTVRTQFISEVTNRGSAGIIP